MPTRHLDYFLTIFCVGCFVAIVFMFYDRYVYIKNLKKDLQKYKDRDEK